MIRGTTPRHVFEFKDVEDISNLKEITITYEQNGELVLYKTLSNLVIDGNIASFRLTQEEALAFEERTPVEVQVKILDEDDNVYASRIFTIPVLKILDEAIL